MATVAPTFSCSIEAGAVIKVDGSRLEGADAVLAQLRSVAGEAVPDAAEMVTRLMAEPVPLAELEAEIDGDAEATERLHRLLQLLGNAKALRLHTAGESPVAVLTPVSDSFTLDLAPIDVTRSYRLSRFAYLHRGIDGWMLVVAPQALARIALRDGDAFSLFGALSRGATLEEVLETSRSEQRDALCDLFAMLCNAPMVELCLEDGSIAEDHDTVRLQWDFHDLLFHARSRIGRAGGPLGATYRFMGNIKPLPPLKPPLPALATVELPHPDLDALVADDKPFTAVLEARRSIRSHGDPPITLQQLGEFLFRAARVRRTVRGDNYDATDRPYPGGGATYELEIYLTVNACAGLERGFYHYDPVGHALRLLQEPNRDMERLLLEAWTASTCWPQILLTFGSRFQRVSWKYEAMAYATQLKNVGALYSVLYLVATAMGLVPCALGAGNAERFCRLAGTDYLVEGSIGEFILGSRGPES